jgi:hypothetical protein
MIKETEFMQLYDNTIKMRLFNKNTGKFENHYHRYKTREKAEAMFHWWKTEFEVAIKN